MEIVLCNIQGLPKYTLFKPKKFSYNCEKLIEDIYYLGNDEISSPLEYQKIISNQVVITPGSDIANLFQKQKSFGNKLKIICCPDLVNSKLTILSNTKIQKNEANYRIYSINRKLKTVLSEFNNNNSQFSSFTMDESLVTSRGVEIILNICQNIQMKDETLISESNDFKIRIVCCFIRNIFILECLKFDEDLIGQCELGNRRLIFMKDTVNPKEISSLNQLITIIQLYLILNDEGSSLMSGSTSKMQDSDSASLISEYSENDQKLLYLSENIICKSGEKRKRCISFDKNDDSFDKDDTKRIRYEFSNSIDILPEEILNHCFSFLCCEEILLIICLTCQKFNSIVSKKQFWKNKSLDITVSRNYDPKPFEKMRKNIGHFIKHLRITEIQHEEVSPMKMLNLGTRNMYFWNNNSINLRSNTNSLEQPLNQYFDYKNYSIHKLPNYINWIGEDILKTLNSLELSGACSITISGIVKLLNIQSLETLIISSFHEDNYPKLKIIKELNEISSNFKSKLTTLSLNVISTCLINDKIFLEEFINSISNISKDIKTFSLKVDSHHPLIYQLNFKKIYKILNECTSISLCNIQVGKHLKTFEKNYNSFKNASQLSIIDWTMKEIQAYTILEHCSKLQKLHMEISPSMDHFPTIMPIYFDKMKDLKIVNFVNCSSLIDACGDLRSLSIICTHKTPILYSVGLQNRRNSNNLSKFKNLKNFSFSSPRIEDEKAILDIMDSCKETLETFHFSINTLTDNIIDSLFDKKLMRNLSLSFADSNCDWIQSLSKLKTIENLSIEIRDFDYEAPNRNNFKTEKNINFDNLKSAKFIAMKKFKKDENPNCKNQTEFQPYDQILSASQGLQRLTICGQAILSHNWFCMINSRKINNLVSLRLSRNVIIPTSEKRNFVKILYKLDKVEELEILDEDGINPSSQGMHLTYYCNIAVALPNLKRTSGIFPDAYEVETLGNNGKSYNIDQNEMLSFIFSNFLYLAPKKLKQNEFENLFHSISYRIPNEEVDPCHLGDEKIIKNFLNDLKRKLKNKKTLPLLVEKLRIMLNQAYNKYSNFSVYKDIESFDWKMDTFVYNKEIEGTMLKFVDKMKIDITPKRLNNSIRLMETPNNRNSKERFGWMDEAFFPKENMQD